MYAEGIKVATLSMLLALVTAVASFAQNDEEERYVLVPVLRQDTRLDNYPAASR